MNFVTWSLLAAIFAVSTLPAAAQSPSGQTTVAPAPTPSQTPAEASPSAPASDSDGRADAYYNFTMGHIYEQQYENTSRAVRDASD